MSYAQVISAVPPWDRKVLDQATDEQLWVLFFFGGGAVTGAWWALIKGTARVVRAWRFPPSATEAAKEEEDDDDD